jgi:hypothetical protein
MLVMTLVVRDEQDIIATNLDYHLAQGVDMVIATDHGSTDGTSEILDRYARDGVVHLIRDPEPGHHQSRRVTAMARLAGERFAADWVLHNDADEFWWPVAGSLRDVFAAIPDAYNALEVWRRVNFLPAPESDGPFQDRLVVREAVSRNGLGKPLEPKAAHRPAADVIVAPGNHWLRGGALRPAPHADMLEIFHFPMRSLAQYDRKVVKLGRGYEQAGPLSPDVGRDQLAMLEVHRRGELAQWYADAVPSPEELQRGIAEGRFVVDRRLQGFLEQLRSLAPGELPATQAAGPAARALVASALAAEQNAATEQQARVAEERARVAEEAAAAAIAERDATGDVLAQIQRSRLMRATASTRRLWYRVSGGSRGR